MFKLVVDTSGMVKGVPAVAGIQAALESSVERALDQSAAAILNRLRTTYRQEQDPDGKAWLPSKAGRIRKEKGTGQTMFASGDLWRSIQLYKTGVHERLIGTDVPYAIYHQNTAGRPPVAVERRFLDITDEHVAMAQKIFETRLKEVLK